MKWYFASRMRHQQKIIAITTFLEKKGETVLSEWVHQPSLKPYEENMQAVQDLASEVIDSLLATDVFVLISDPEGTDMFIELGVCLARNKTIPTKIYIVGEHAKRSLMQLHPAIMHVDSIEEIFKREVIDCKDFQPVLFD